MKTILDRIRSEPAALIGLAVSVAQCFQGGAHIEDAVPLAVGIVIRFFVSPATKPGI